MTLFTKHTITLLGLATMLNTATAQSLPDKKKALVAMEKANNYFKNKWPDPGAEVTVRGVTRTSNLWTRAVYYEGLMALYNINYNQADLDYAILWGKRHNWKVRDKTSTRNADNQCCGQTYIDVYHLTHDPACVQDIKASVDLMMATDKIDDWSWIDALQMGMPVFVRLGVDNKDTSYFNRMYKMYAFTKNEQGGKGLFNPEDNLWWRDKDFVPPYKEPNGQDCYWSRGNGWVVAALVRTLDILPKTDPHYAEYLGDYKKMLKALLPLQRTDGFWNVSLHDATHFGGKELTGTALFVYGMAYGINHKLIDRKTYLPVLTKAWNAMVKDGVHDNGALGYVQGTGKEPKDGQPVTYDSIPDFEDYGLGCFLLAGSEVYKLSAGK